MFQDNNTAITSRDIRVKHGQVDGVTTVTEIIRNNSVTFDDKDNTNQLPEANNTAVKPAKHNKPADLPPIVIPDASEVAAGDWGDSRTPGADEHTSLSPLDENIFDSPTGSLTEMNLSEQLRHSTSSRPPSDPSMPLMSNVSAMNSTLNGSSYSIEENLRSLLQIEEGLFKSPPTADRDQLLKQTQGMISDMKLLYIQQQQKQQQHNASIQATSMLLQQMQPYQQQSVWPPTSLASNSQPPIGTRPRPQKPVAAQQLTTTIPLLQQQQQTQKQHQFDLLDLQKNSVNIGEMTDHMVKLKQLSDITRYLKTPGGLLDDEQVNQLMITKNLLLNQLNEEELRKAMLAQRDQSMIGSDVISGGTTGTGGTVPVTSTSQHEQLMQLMKLREERVLKPHNNTTYNTTVTSQDSHVLPHDVERKANTSRITAPNQSQPSQFSNDGTIEITHTSKIDTKPKHPSFVSLSYDRLRSMSHKEWINAELLNLEHRSLTDSKARFFSVICAETRPGKFVPNLSFTFTRNILYLLDSDAKQFKKLWSNSDGPIFLIIKHRPYQTGESWKVGGLCHVLSNILPVKDPSSKLKYYCKVNPISAIIFTADIRSDIVTHELATDNQRAFIYKAVVTLQEGNCMSLFRHQEIVASKVQQPEEKVIICH